MDGATLGNAVVDTRLQIFFATRGFFHASLHPHQVIAAIILIAAVAMVHQGATKDRTLERRKGCVLITSRPRQYFQTAKPPVGKNAARGRLFFVGMLLQN
jgi:hypothetical protein